MISCLSCDFVLRYFTTGARNRAGISVCDGYFLIAWSVLRYDLGPPEFQNSASK